MFALNAPIKARLQSLPALAGWTVRTSTELVDRATLPAVDVRLPGGGVAGARSGAVMVQPGWSLVLAVRRSATAADELEAAFAATRIRVADGEPQRILVKGQQHMPGEEAWLIGELRSSGVPVGGHTRRW